MIHGYYIAATRQRFGVRRMSAMAARAWRRLGHRAPGRQAGAAAWIDDERFVIRIVANDLFGTTTASYPPAPPFVIPRYLVQDFAFNNAPCSSPAKGGPT